MSDIQTLQNSLTKKQAELATLEKELEAAREAQFTELPAKLGLNSMDALIKALAGYASSRLKGALKSAFGEKIAVAAPKSEDKAEVPAKAGKRKRARITPELKEEIITALKAGGRTAGAVAAEFSVSVAAVNIIKRDAGLTKKKE
jgi:hypothetical protein